MILEPDIIKMQKEHLLTELGFYDNDFDDEDKYIDYLIKITKQEFEDLTMILIDKNVDKVEILKRFFVFEYICKILVAYLEAKKMHKHNDLIMTIKHNDLIMTINCLVDMLKHNLQFEFKNECKSFLTNKI